MTIRIPLRFLLFVLYTTALLGGAFGISYAVFEWRDDDGAIERRIDDLERQGAGPTQAELDAELCAAALQAFSDAGTLDALQAAEKAVESYCD